MVSVPVKQSIVIGFNSHSMIHKSSFLIQLSIDESGGISYLPTPPLGQDITQGQFLSEV